VRTEQVRCPPHRSHASGAKAPGARGMIAETPRTARKTITKNCKKQEQLDCNHLRRRYSTQCIRTLKIKYSVCLGEIRTTHISLFVHFFFFAASTILGPGLTTTGQDQWNAEDHECASMHTQGWCRPRVPHFDLNPTRSNWTPALAADAERSGWERMVILCPTNTS
jgi:hypothetical protein